MLISSFVRFLNEHFRAVYRAFDFKWALRDWLKNVFEILYVINELVSMQHAIIKLYKHLGGLLRT